MTPEQEIKVAIFDILQKQTELANQQQSLEQEKAQLDQEKNLLLKKLEKLKVASEGK